MFFRNYNLFTEKYILDVKKIFKYFFNFLSARRGWIMLFKIKKMEKKIKEAFKKISLELEEHLEAINTNTNEIQSNYEEILELHKKIERLSERIDELQMLIAPRIKFENIHLTEQEEEVFISLYTSNQKLSTIQISQRTGLSPEQCENLIYSMMVKGLPIYREINGGNIFFYLDPYFKDLQARKRVINLRKQY